MLLQPVIVISAAASVINILRPLLLRYLNFSGMEPVLRSYTTSLLLLELLLLPRPVYWISFYNFQFGGDEMGERDI